MDESSGPIEDIFDAALNLEETHMRKGYEEGYAHGLETGKEEGRQVGLKTGFEVGEELGFYRGCIDVWEAAICVDPHFFSSRVKASIDRMGELLVKYDLFEPKDTGVQDILQEMRLKFRIIRAGLGVKLDYDGYPKPKEMEF